MKDCNLLRGENSSSIRDFSNHGNVKGCAYMQGGSVIEITILAHQVELAQSVKVQKFEWMDEAE